jgi:hypothetical protein
MASRLFALIALLLITAGIAAFLVAAGWIPWTYPGAGQGGCVALVGRVHH